MSINVINPPSSGGVGEEVDPLSLHLSGGTMGLNATVLFPQTNGNDSEIGAWGFGVENSNGSFSTVEPTQIVQSIYVAENEYGNSNNQSTIISGPQITINGRQWDLSNILTLSSSGLNISFYNGESSLSLDTEKLTILSGANDNPKFDLSPVNGLEFINYSINPFVSLAKYQPSGITFADGTVQTTAASDFKAGGTLNDYAEIKLRKPYFEDEEGNDHQDGVVLIQPNSLMVGWDTGYPDEEYQPVYRTVISGDTISQREDADLNHSTYSSKGWSVANGALIGDASGITFPDGTVQTTAGFFNGGNISGSIFININNQDENTLGLGPSGITSLSQQVNSFNLDAYGVSGHDELINTNGVNWGFGVNGALFSDGSTQTTAGIPEAPNDGIPYIRVNGTWVSMFEYL